MIQSDIGFFIVFFINLIDLFGFFNYRGKRAKGVL